jgi:hypothetical protein
MGLSNSASRYEGLTNDVSQGGGLCTGGLIGGMGRRKSGSSSISSMCEHHHVKIWPQPPAPRGTYPQQWGGHTGIRHYHGGKGVRRFNARSRYPSACLDGPSRLATAVPGGQGGSTRTPSPNMLLPGPRGLAAVHALHTADHAKRVANIAAAVAFTAIAGVGTSRSSTGRGCR